MHSSTAPQLSEFLGQAIDGSSNEADVSLDQTMASSRSCAENGGASLISKPKETAETAVACAFFTGDYESASTGASALLHKQPHLPMALYWLIKADERRAFQCLARFQQLEPNSARSHVLLGDIYRQRERYDDAIAEYQKALNLAPNDPASLLGLASAQLSNNDIEGAIKVAGAALARTPSDPEINLVMAEALIDNHKYAEAETFLAKSKNIKPQMLPHVHALLGRAYAETGNIPRAIAELKLGESSDVDGSVHYQLARLYRQLGEGRAADEALKEMKEIKERRRDQKLIAVDDPDNPISPPKPSASTSHP
jgi:tetratricopeptide (TPR) repeat protein